VKGDGDLGAIFPHQVKVQITHLPGTHHAGKVLRRPFNVARREKISEPVAYHLLPGISQELQPGLINLPDNAVFV
jgi:hypothetical protein